MIQLELFPETLVEVRLILRWVARYVNMYVRGENLQVQGHWESLAVMKETFPILDKYGKKLHGFAQVHETLNLTGGEWRDLIDLSKWPASSIKWEYLT